MGELCPPPEDVALREVLASRGASFRLIMALGKGGKMGQISLFMGILVYMYTEPGSPHKLPHIHIVCGGEKAAISIPDGEVLAISENFPPKKLRAIQTWIDLRTEDLLADWELAKAGKKPLWVQPLI